MVTKQVQFNRNARNITVGASQQFTPLVMTARDNMTVVGIIVDIAMGLEAPTDLGGVNLAGYARIAVYRAGNAIPLIQPNGAWAIDSLETPQVDTLLDDDAGDTWAIVPFAIAAGLVANPVFTGGTGAFGQNIQLHMSPQTKRTLRRGDQIVVELNYSNSGSQNSEHQEAVTGTLFTVD